MSEQSREVSEREGGRRRLGAALRWVGVGTISLMVLGLCWTFIEATLITTETYKLALHRWPATHPPLKVALLGDIHSGAPFNGLARLDDIVTATNAVNPDVIILAGDYVYHGTGQDTSLTPEQIAASLARLKAPLGVYGVLGNHDWWDDGPRVRRAMDAAGVPMLEDRAVRLEHDGAAFWLVGVSDLWESACDVGGAMRQVTDDSPILMVTHNPDTIEVIPEQVALTMAGHTHGGQVWLPGFGAPLVPIKNDFRTGFFQWPDTATGRALFVTPGLGTTALPVRFMVPPEISILELVASTERNPTR